MAVMGDVGDMSHAVALPYVEPGGASRPRIIVALTMMDGRLVRTRAFKSPIYVGDPINAVKIFSDKGADELVLLEIGRKPFDAAREDFIRKIASEAMMPISFGGGIRTIDQVRAVIRCGFEKVVLNSALHDDLSLATAAASEFGAQAIVGSIEVGETWLRGRHVRTHCGRKAIRFQPEQWAMRCAEAGCGELLITSIRADGSMRGYDLDVIGAVSRAVPVPVVALGGAGSQEHLAAAIRAGASAVAAGSMFVLHGPRRAVLITYPEGLGEHVSI
jgi:cyclase